MEVGLQYLHERREQNSEGIISQCSCVRVKWAAFIGGLSACAPGYGGAISPWQLNIEVFLTSESAVLLSAKQVPVICVTHKHKLCISDICYGVCYLLIGSATLNNSYSDYIQSFVLIFHLVITNNFSFLFLSKRCNQSYEKSFIYSFINSRL